VKNEIAHLGAAALGERAHFVGAHPMAGSEKTGWQHSSAELFQQRPCFVTPLTTTAPAATAAVVKFWHDLGAQPVTVAPKQHDEIVAHISHLPQILASTLCAFLAERDTSWRDYAGGGLRDTTRIAASDPQLWRTILEQNHKEILRAVQQYQAELSAFQKALAEGEYATVVDHLKRGQVYRRDFRPAP
jgi:prephenate dehydrogenase